MIENKNNSVDVLPGGILVNKYLHPMIGSLVQIVMKKWWLFLVVGLLAACGGIYYASIQKPQYESRLSFALDAGNNDGGLAGAMNFAAQLGLGGGSGQSLFEGDNIIEILKSRRIIENVLLSVDTFVNKPVTFAEYYLDMSGLRKGLDKNAHLKNIHFPPGSNKATLTYLQDSVLSNIYKTFSTEFISAERPDKKLGIYEVRIKTSNEKFSKKFTDKLVEQAGAFYTEITSKKERETLEILEQRVASLKGNVSVSIESKASTQDANLNAAFAAAQSPLYKQQYNIEAYGEAYKEMFKTLEMARYQYLKTIPLLQIIDHADYPMQRIKMAKIKTGFIFSVGCCFILFFVLWVRSLLKKKPVSQ